MSEIFFHIGLHKTGTTFLQRAYFPKLDISYVKGGKPYFKVLNTIGSTNGKILISEENLSGELFSGSKITQFKANVDAIAKSFPSAGILIGVRKQSEFVLSSYKQHLHEGGTMDIYSLFNEKNTGVLKLEDLEFSKMFELISKKFSNVFLYTIEDVRNIANFDKHISSFLRTKSLNPDFRQKQINRSIKSITQVKWLLRLNQFDKKIKSVFGVRLLYSKLFKYLKITPRYICQNYMPDKGKIYELPRDIKTFIDREYNEDWLKTLSYKYIQ